jgi:hypothetical protein
VAAYAIVWCQPCGEDWYISGGRFLDIDVEVQVEELEERTL